METQAAVYNGLPTLDEVDNRFLERETLFKEIAALLAQYRYIFGLCLVHAHCILSDDEIMVGRGNVFQPEKASEVTGVVYPERWLASGQPYEFTTRPTVTPPADLFQAFNRLAGHLGVLGLHHIDQDEKNDKMVEHTEGRKNIQMPYMGSDEADLATQTLTAWDLGRYDPVTLACNKVVICDRITTRSAIEKKHKGRYT